ncbi:asparagine synthetase B, partial [Candidatus Kaiserbacteria bacterium CG10_big_fil_rev_8_21_14_0_10_45_20]
MCAINGFTWEDKEKISLMNSATKSRGPDHSGVFIDGISLGHNRLSIIDLDNRSDQPSRSPDGRYTLIYNGELYNFKDLKKSISYDFKTTSDTEVVLAAFL